jgi:hypothetical protein
MIKKCVLFKKYLKYIIINEKKKMKRPGIPQFKATLEIIQEGKLKKVIDRKHNGIYQSYKYLELITKRIKNYFNKKKVWRNLEISIYIPCRIRCKMTFTLFVL